MQLKETLVLTYLATVDMDDMHYYVVNIIIITTRCNVCHSTVLGSAITELDVEGTVRVAFLHIRGGLEAGTAVAIESEIENKICSN